MMKIFYKFSLVLTLMACSSEEPNAVYKNEDTLNPKSSMADLNKNQSSYVLSEDGRIKGCKSKQ